MKHWIVIMGLALAGVGSAHAHAAKAASEAAEAVEHKYEVKRADNAAAKSGPVGKVVNKTKAGYHKAQSKRSANKAKASAKKAVQ